MSTEHTPAVPDAVLYLVDTSVWARLPRHAAVRDRLDLAQSRGQIVLAPPIMLEVGFSARDATQWERTMTQLKAFPVLPMDVLTHEVARGLQGALWRAGKVRAAGAVDTLVAALAVQHRAVVLHYDRDYEHLASVAEGLRHEWVAPSGTLD